MQVDAVNRQKFAAKRALKALHQARERGAMIQGTGPILPGSMVSTDAIVYRQIAAELGRLPSELIKSVVTFYSLALELGRLADSASTAQIAYETILQLAPRLMTHAAILIRTLENFEASDFAVNADVRPKPDEVRTIATQMGYPIDQILSERGFRP